MNSRTSTRSNHRQDQIINKIKLFINRILHLEPNAFPGHCLVAQDSIKTILQSLESANPEQFNSDILEQLKLSLDNLFKFLKQLKSRRWAARNFDLPISRPMEQLSEIMTAITNVCRELGLQNITPFNPPLPLIINDYQYLIGLYTYPQLLRDPRQPSKIEEISNFIDSLNQINADPQPQPQPEPEPEPDQPLEPNSETYFRFASINIQQYRLRQSDYQKNKNDTREYNGMKYYTGRMVATQEPIFVYSWDISNDEQKFLNLVQLYAAMKHPGIETIIGYSTEPSYEIITRASGEPLSNILRKRNSEDGDDVITLLPGDRTMIAFKIAQACAFLHGNNIIHRDLSTANIYIDHNKNPKLTNFAHSRIMPEDRRHLTNILIRTSKFLAPEICTPTDDYDESIDVFAFAGVLYELLNGSAPFNKNSHDKAHSLICAGERPAISPKCPPPLKELIESCWRQDPSKRPSFIEIVDQMIANGIHFPEDVNSVPLSQFYNSQSIRNKSLQQYLTLFKNVFEEISRAEVYRHEATRASFVLHTYYYHLQHYFAQQENGIDGNIECYLSNIAGSLDVLCGIFQVTQSEWSSMALTVPTAQISLAIKKEMDDIYNSMTQLGFTNLQQFTFIPCDILSDYRNIYAAFKNCVDGSSIPPQYVIEAKKRIEEILAFMSDLKLQIDLNPVELNNNIQKIVKAFKIYEKPRSNYKLKKLIGSGITSSVYHAVDLSQNTVVAIKEFDQNYFSDEDAIVRFKREISLLATLDHPYIVKFIGFNFDLEQPFWVISEYAANGDLFRAKIELDGFQKTKIMFEIAEGMEYLHDKHILHRDLKTLNVLLVGDTPKITDFGYSKSNLSLYNTERVGTPQYMAPEVLRGEPYGYPADVTSFARMLWELYYGTHPWSWLDNSKHFKVISTGSQPLPFEKPISPELRALIIAGDNMDPTLRPTFSAILNIMIQQQIAYPGADREQVRQFYAEKARARGKNP